MGYYVRVLAEKAEVIPVSEIQKRLDQEGLVVRADLEAGKANDWWQIVLRHQSDGVEITSIERDVVDPGELGESEIEEFLEEIEDARPESAAQWLTQYLPSVKVIYAFQILSGTDDRPGGWEAVHAVMDELHTRLGGIHQADAEGFTNQNGHHILWDFPDGVEGPYEMAVLEEDTWRAFEMDLGNPAHREAFLNGQVPDGVTLL